MYKKALLCVAMTFGVLQSPALAQSNGAISPKLSTLGLGLEYRYDFSSNWAASAGIYGMSISRTETRSDIKYDADLKLRHFAVLGHYYPWENGFRFSGGLVFNGTKLDGRATTANGATINLDGINYTSASLGSVQAKADFRKVAPYLGLGWDSGDRSSAGLSFTADLGVMFTGKPNVSLTPNFAAGCDAACRTAIQTRADNERASLEKDLDSFKAYPVISVGLTYRF